MLRRMAVLRRKECGEKEKRFLRKVKREHSLFKYQMLSGTNREIYDSWNKICFYENLIEYFLYKEDIDEEIVEAGLQAEDLLDELYHVYLKYEWLQITSWEKIEEILTVYVGEKKGGILEVK